MRRLRGHWLRLTDTHTDALLLILIIVAFVPLVFLRNGNELLRGTDYEQMIGFSRRFLWRTITHEHTLPLWAPWSFSGRPFQADPSSQVFYPIEWFLLPLLEGLGLVVSTIIHLAIAGTGVLVLGRALRMRRSGAMFAAIAFACSGYFVARAFVGHSMFVQSAPYLPWVLAGIEVGTRDGSWRPYRRAGVAFALQILTGCIPVAWMTGLAALLYQVLRMPLRREVTPWWLAARGLLIVFGVGVGLSAVQLLPTAELARLSIRAAAGPEYAAEVGFPPSHFLLWLFPSLPLSGFGFRWETNSYAAVLTILAALCALPQWRDPRVRAFGGLFALGTGLMLADATPLFWLWYYAVPGYASLRVHAREALMCCLALCILGGLGFDRLQHREVGRWVVVLGGALAIAGLIAGIPWWQAALLVLSPLVLHGLRRRPAWLVPGALLLLLVDLTANALHFPTLFQFLPGKPEREAALLQQLTADVDLYRVWLPPGVIHRNAGYAIERSTVDGIAPLVLRDYADLISALTATPWYSVSPNSIPDAAFTSRPTPFVLSLLNVRYTMTRDPTGWRWEFLSDPNASGPVMQPGDWQVLPDRDAVIAALRSGDFDSRQRVLFEEAPFEQPPRASSSIGSARVTHYGANSISVDIDQTRDGFVVLSEIFYPGWQAELDGRPTRIYRADGVLRAVFAPAGRHELRCVFRPVPLQIGAAITLVALLALAGSYRWREIKQ
ncbi:MAG: hypothetical protein HYR72_13270 [Deltaproteobacteria bacterium]|nr:hypothetical protein [Deltaproteobacteria bacterium]MBI3386881.1 hypothetical protein [Deltaproteobacteria bacterium]